MTVYIPGLPGYQLSSWQSHVLTDARGHTTWSTVHCTTHIIVIHCNILGYTELNCTAINYCLVQCSALKSSTMHCSVWTEVERPDCILYTVYCLLYTVYCILYTVYCILYTVYCVLYTVYCILYTVYCILYSVSGHLCWVLSYREFLPTFTAASSLQEPSLFCVGFYCIVLCIHIVLCCV